VRVIEASAFRHACNRPAQQQRQRLTMSGQHVPDDDRLKAS
jgi:hypothetical protein